MVTATQEILVDPLGRQTCLHGHSWTLETRRVDLRGVWHCRLCNQASERRSQERRRQGLRPNRYFHAELHESRPQPEKVPVSPARWHVYQLTPEEQEYTPEEKLRRLREWFCRLMGHCPALIRCSERMAGELRAYIRSNAATAARWESCTIRGDEAVGDDGSFGMR